ncbi:MAG: cytochrome b/b6 domain-containing protein [Proteobacteria bacterium]|nr:cytochrome b/b6 domain-containing protein [Pseudomonadota bacterium]
MEPKLQQFKVWDRTTRVFHWINVVSVFSLIILGTMILNAKTLGIEGESKLLLKTIHAYVGYVFAINLLWRFVWAFSGNYYAQWRQFLPVEKGYIKSLKDHISNYFSGEKQQYIGHNPPGKLIITLFFLVLTMQVLTGLTIAGTDLYKPPFGSYFAEWVTEGEPNRLNHLRPGDKTNVVEEAYLEMRNFRKPFITLHIYGFYILLILVPIHVVGVIAGELREQNGLISSMITGNKILSDEPKDKKSTAE